MIVTVIISGFCAIESAKDMDELGRIFTTIFKDSIVLTLYILDFSIFEELCPPYRIHEHISQISLRSEFISKIFI